jgi:thiosulfate/3-mercaptopyruvate sulfurtransferase
VRVVDIRDAASYAEGHIAGAVNAPYGAWRGPATNPGELPPLAKLTELVQQLGLTPATHVIVVSSGADSTDFGASARVYWTLKVLGLRELSILNGGYEAWGAAGLPLDTTPVAIAPSRYQPRIDTRLIATREDVARSVKTHDALLIDSRPAAQFRGETRHPAAKAAGTILGAVNLDNAKWFEPEKSTFVGAGEARRIAASLPLSEGRQAVAFCNTGHWAATNWFALSEVLGVEDAKLYPGSMVEWSKDASLPMDNAPGRVGQLLVDAKMKLKLD